MKIFISLGCVGLLTCILLSGCGPKLANDKSFKFVSYYPITEEPDPKNLPDRSLSLATNETGDIYLKEIKRDKHRNETLTCTLLLNGVGEVKEYKAADDNQSYDYILTKNNALYMNGYIMNRSHDIFENSRYKRVMQNIESVKFVTPISLLLLNTEGRLYGMGDNRQGECGVGFISESDGSRIYEPRLILKDVRDYGKAEYYKSYAITNTNDLYVWGVDKVLHNGGLYEDYAKYQIASPTLRAKNVDYVVSEEDYLTVYYLDGTYDYLNEQAYMDAYRETVFKKKK